jgi:hypothetical protein
MITVFLTRQVRLCANCLIFLLVLVGLGACGSAESPAFARPKPLLLPTPLLKTSRPITSAFRQQWLTKQPCTPPCWEGITPGKTKLREAVEILNKHPFVGAIEDNTYTSLTATEPGVAWRWNGSTEGYGLLSSARRDLQDIANLPAAEDSIVSRIVVVFPEPFTLAEIRSAYGDPSHVVPYVGYGGIPGGSSGGSTFYEFTVVYLERGFFLETERDTFDPPTIDPQMTLSSHVVFFPPTVAGLEAVSVSMRGWQSTDLLPWQGFLDFVDYCAQIRPIKDAQQHCPQIDGS